MDLTLNMALSGTLENGSQIARRVTEAWVGDNMFCPRCGCNHLEHFENNRPVADFYCSKCGNQYELKSKNGAFGQKINDGAYDTMIERITGNNNPDFLLMTYSRRERLVKNFMIIPKHFFVPDIIERRKPLGLVARRAGWIGCNILLNMIPVQGRIMVVNDGKIQDKNTVLRKIQLSKTLETDNLSMRGWLMDVLQCVNRMPEEFSLKEIYQCEQELQQKHLGNNNVRPKIRQQLQFLRDRGLIMFLENGKYRKLDSDDAVR